MVSPAWTVFTFRQSKKPVGSGYGESWSYGRTWAVPEWCSVQATGAKRWLPELRRCVKVEISAQQPVWQHLSDQLMRCWHSGGSWRRRSVVFFCPLLSMMVLSFFASLILLVPLDTPRKDFKVFRIFEELFVFVIDSSVYSPPGIRDSQCIHHQGAVTPQCIHHQWVETPRCIHCHGINLNWFTKEPAKYSR